VATDQNYGDGARQKLDVYAPPAASGLPVIVFIYGGSWSSGDKSDYAFAGAALASQGFVTVIPDYGLVPEVRFPGFIEDCSRAVRWAADHAAHYGGDASKTFGWAPAGAKHNDAGSMRTIGRWRVARAMRQLDSGAL
jgi:acetyl esterase/lipase